MNNSDSSGRFETLRSRLSQSSSSGASFISIVLTDVGGGTVALVVGIYAVAIVLTMAIIGSGIGMAFTA